MSFSAQRAAFLERRLESLERYEAELARGVRATRASEKYWKALDAAEGFMAAALSAESDYFKALPRLPLSRCPFCDQQLVRSFDPHGLDGPWWRTDASAAEPQPCRHFCCLTGAVRFNDQPARGGDFEAHIGPAVPFVIPRILALEGVVAVLTRVPMDNGYTVFTIAYFAERRPPPQELTADWPRTLYLYETQLGETLWRVASEAYDFDLAPWLRSGKLRWTAGATEPLATFSTGPNSCPYVGLEGDRSSRIVSGERCWTELRHPEAARI